MDGSLMGPAGARIKGTAILSIVKALRGYRDQARTLLPPALHHYLEDRILVSEWYPESDQLDLLRALSRILPDQGMDPWEFMGRFTAQRDLSGLYKAMFREGSPADTLKRGSLLWKSYHDTGSTEIVFEGDVSACVSLRDYGLPSREMCGILGGWYGEMVRMSGGREVQVSHEECVLEKGDCCRWAIKWLEPEED